MGIEELIPLVSNVLSNYKWQPSICLALLDWNLWEVNGYYSVILKKTIWKRDENLRQHMMSFGGKFSEPGLTFCEISRKSNLPRWTANSRKCCGLSFVRKTSNQIIPFITCICFWFFSLHSRAVILDICSSVFSNFIILFLINKKVRTSPIFSS